MAGRRMRMRITEAEMRKHARAHIQRFDRVDRNRVAFEFLEYMATHSGVFYTTAQIRAAAEGLRLGMTEGVR
jgi:predicted hotdog family 3-hydroxylacyl-ACP dehydratase